MAKCENPNCEIIVIRKTKRNKFKKYCSAKCQGQHCVRKASFKRKATNLARYGVEHPKQCKEVQDKWKATNFERYGVECGFQAPEIKEKIEITIYEKYGSTNIAKSKYFKEKIAEIWNEKSDEEINLIVQKRKITNFERYGVEVPIQSEEIFDKIKQTNLSRYGTENASKSQEIIDRIYQTQYNNHGDWAINTKSIQNKIKKTLLENYGVENPSYSQEILDKIRNTRESNGTWIKFEDNEYKEQYYALVLIETNKSYRLNINKLDPNKIRSREFHLDHIYSIQQGFLNDVLPEIIGHWTNLRIISGKENIGKSIKCNKTIEELYYDYKFMRSN